MKIPIVLVFLSLIFPLGFVVAHGEINDFSTDKEIYHKNDQLSISGNVQFDPDVPFITIQIFTPGKSGFADFKTFSVGSDGLFSAVFHVGGPTWTIDGDYPIKVTYDGNMEKTIKYKEFTDQIQSEPEAQPEPTAEPEAQPEPTAEPEAQPEKESNFITSKFKIPNFPSFDKSPQYYIDRYDNEQSYKRWFDSQFPNDSIYNILGYKDPISVPDWIRNNAEWWAIGEISDSTFVSGIEFMLENDIIRISSISPSGNVSEDEIPSWIRNNAHWWSQDLISEEEFINSLKFLIQNRVIAVN